MSTASPDVAVIVPTLNEGSTIRRVIHRILGTGLVTWVIIVDDSSTDNTAEVVESLLRADSRVRLLARAGKEKSFARSYAQGFQYALDLGADLLIQMDADGSHDARDIPRVIAALKCSDVVVGSRYVVGGKNKVHSRLRHLLSYFGSWISSAILHIPIHDMTGGFNGWTADVIRRIAIEENQVDGFGFQVWLKWRAHMTQSTIVEVPIIFATRLHGSSKFRLSMAFELLVAIIRMRSETSQLKPTNYSDTPPNPQSR